MKIAVASEGRDLTAPMGSVFGRCPVFVLVDTETGRVDAQENAAGDASSGAGVEAARLVVYRGAEVVIAPRVGPKAQDVLDAAAIRVHLHQGGTVGDALAAWQSKGDA